MVVRSPASKARRRVDVDEAVANDPGRSDLDRAAAVSRIARRKSTIPPALATTRRQCIARARAQKVVLREIAARLGVTVPRVIQLLNEHRRREATDCAAAGGLPETAFEIHQIDPDCLDNATPGRLEDQQVHR